MKNLMPLIICITGLVVYAVVLTVYCIKISRAKRFVAPGKTVPRTSRSFKAIFITALLLEILPMLVPLATYVIAAVAASGVLGEYLALRDRLEEIRQLR